MEPLELKNVQISTIQPFEKTDHVASFDASLFDLGVVDFYMPTILFYTSKTQSDAGELVAKMKASLSKVLVPFFPFAGRWVTKYDASIRVLECNDEGVPFIEASVDVELDSVLNKGNFAVRPELGGYRLLGLDPFAFNQHVHSPSPAVFVQATTFKCGGVALNVCIHHMTADGVGMLKFMKAWSEFALNGETLIVPTHGRSGILSKETFMEFLAGENGSPLATNGDEGSENTSHTAVVSNGTNGKKDRGDAFRIQHVEPLINKIFHVRRQAVEDLKRKAAEEKIDVTSVDLITAHLWQSVTKLVNPEEKPVSVLATYVDGRKRFHDPPLSEDFTGNAVILAGPPPIPSTELTNYSPIQAASTIHTAIRSLNKNTWQNSLVQSYKVASLTELPFAFLGISSWYRFPTYEISFGCGYGNPVFVCLNISSGFLPQGIAFIFPPPPSESDDCIASVQLFIQKGDGFAETLYTNERFLAMFRSLTHV